MAKFEVGKSYSFRFACNWDRQVVLTIKRRTAKRITFDYLGEEVTKGVSEADDGEICYPLGRYSMCPVISAIKPHEQQEQ